jgi:hypothetical protein
MYKKYKSINPIIILFKKMKKTKINKIIPLIIKINNQHKRNYKTINHPLNVNYYKWDLIKN